MKLYKIVLVLVLMICGVLVEAEPQVKVPILPQPTVTPKTTSTTSSTTTSLPPILPTSPTAVVPSPTESPSAPPIQPPLETTPKQGTLPTPTTPTPSTPPSTQTSPSDTAQPNPSCSESNVCPDPITTFCNLSLGKCQPRGKIGDNCNSKDECLDPFVCSQNNCQYSDAGQNNNRDNNNKYNIKRIAILGAIVVGASCACGLIFFVYRYFKKRKDYEITSRLYSTDDETSEPDPYPFNEGTNSFSNNTVQPPHAPPKMHYENFPPTRNRGFAAPHQGYSNYYNEYNNNNNSNNNNNNNNDGRYMRQNEDGARAMNILQQTRGNVITPQQNYNWNPLPQGLFPIPSVKRNYGVPIPNNRNNFNNNNNNNSNNSKSSYSVDYSINRNNNNQADANSNTLSPDNVRPDKQNLDPSTYSSSIIDYYGRESIFAKTIGNRLSMFKNNKDNKNNHPDNQVSERKVRVASRTLQVNDPELSRQQ